MPLSIDHLFLKFRTLYHIHSGRGIINGRTPQPRLSIRRDCTETISSDFNSTKTDRLSNSIDTMSLCLLCHLTTAPRTPARGPSHISTFWPMWKELYG